MNIADFLAELLQGGQGQPQNRMSGNWRGADSAPNRLVQPMQAVQQMAQQAAPMPQAAPPAAIAQPQAPQPDQVQTASVAAPAADGGGIGGFLGNLFGGGQRSSENQTIQWLQQQGMDPGTATMMAKSKPILQAYLLKRSQGGDVSEFDQRAQAAKQYGLDPSSSAGRDFVLSGKLPIEKTDNKPAGIQEYEYAKGQGFPGTFADWEASKKGGMSLQVDENGVVSFQQGGNIKPMTEAQSKDTVFSTKAEGSLPTIDKFGDALTSLPESVGGQIPVIGNYMKSAEYQQAEQAGREFIAAILRKESGAAISIPERNEYGGMYLPEPGDKPPLLAQKKEARQRALNAIKAGMTPQAILAQEKALRNDGEAPPPAASGAPAARTTRQIYDDLATGKPPADGGVTIAPGIRRLPD